MHAFWFRNLNPRVNPRSFVYIKWRRRKAFQARIWKPLQLESCSILLCGAFSLFSDPILKNVSVTVQRQEFEKHEHTSSASCSCHWSFYSNRIKTIKRCPNQTNFHLAQLTLKHFEASWKQRPFNTWGQNIKATYERRIQVIHYRTKILSSSIHIVVFDNPWRDMQWYICRSALSTGKILRPFLGVFLWRQLRWSHCSTSS